MSKSLPPTPNTSPPHSSENVEPEEDVLDSTVYPVNFTSEVDPENFTLREAQEEMARYFNLVSWLNHLGRKEDGELCQKELSIWTERAREKLNEYLATIPPSKPPRSPSSPLRRLSLSNWLKKPTSPGGGQGPSGSTSRYTSVDQSTSHEGTEERGELSKADEQK